MALMEDLEKLAAKNSLELKPKGKVLELSAIIAERKAFLTTKKLQYLARLKIDEAKKEVHFSEMLKESGFGLSTGSDEISPGFGFKTETYSTIGGGGARKGGIEEQSKIFGKSYTYKFDYAKIRDEVEALVKKNGFSFHYQILPV